MPRLRTGRTKETPHEGGFFAGNETFVMMYRPALFLTQTAVVLMVAAIHLSALQWYLYWYYPWLDLLSHFLGGLWVALAAAWLILYIGRETSLIRILSAVMVIGIGWEIFEFYAGIPKEANFVFDTSLDLLMDFCGGLFGYLLAGRLAKNVTITAQ